MERTTAIITKSSFKDNEEARGSNNYGNKDVKLWTVLLDSGSDKELTLTRYGEKLTFTGKCHMKPTSYPRLQAQVSSNS